MALGGFFSKLKQGLSRSTQKLTENLGAVFVRRKLDDEALDDLENMLIAADLGTAVAARIIAAIRRTRFGREVTDEEVKQASPRRGMPPSSPPGAKPLVIDRALHPHVVLVVGVNGTGKTTTIGKLAQHYKDEGLSPILVAGDTFRAAAVEQLQVWGQRSNCPVISAPPNSDAAGLAFDALVQARAANADVLLLDTAGRLHNKAALMDEGRKDHPRGPCRLDLLLHSVLLVLDATTGQNALNQVDVFKEMVAVTGLIVTKLDGSARGGIVVALAEEFGIPVHAVGAACRSRPPSVPATG